MGHQDNDLQTLAVNAASPKLLIGVVGLGGTIGTAPVSIGVLCQLGTKRSAGTSGNNFLDESKLGCRCRHSVQLAYQDLGLYMSDFPWHLDIG